MNHVHYVLRITLFKMTFQLRRYIGIICVIGILSIIHGCIPPQETPGRRPPEIDRQRRVQEEMERSTAEWAYQQGLQSLSKENYPEAIHYFQLAVERDAMHLRAYLSLGDVYSMQDNYVIAETYYNKVLKYDPQSIPAYTALATMQKKMGNYRESLSLYRKVLEIDPMNQFARQQIDLVSQALFDLYYEQGMIYKDAGEIDSALTEFQKAHSFYPEDIEFAVEIGFLFFEQRDYIMADRYFQQALSDDPNYFPAIIGAGKVQLALEHYNEAMNYLKKGLELRPEDDEATELLDQTQADNIKKDLPPQYGEILTAEQVTRGDVAALFMVELVLESHLQPSPRLEIISDVTTHWAKPYIIKIVQFGIMDLPPDRDFRPNEPISKGELAFVLDTLFRRLSIPLPGASTVSFSDVHRDNIRHDAVLQVYSAGLMMASTEDAFGFKDPVSGLEVMQILEKVKLMVR